MHGMRALRHHILPWVLSLLVALTAQAAAVAHAAPGPSGQIELCNSTGPVMVYVDADGQPIGDPVYCPDFALSLILSLDAPPVVPLAMVASVARVVPDVIAWDAVSRDVLRQRARGPPFAI